MRPFPPFQHYPEKIRHWVAAKNWPGFTAIQQAALQVIPIDRAQPLGDFILAAETSSGKTEAAFLPLFARSLGRPREAQKRFSLLYISPLRALINDQYGRLAELGKQLDLPVFRWHSDVPDREKDAARAAGRGVLLTTPESMEAFFLRGAD
jgi:ATP-dependent Lhr-like helicase